MDKEDPLKSFVAFNIKRLITRLYKSHLNNLLEINQKNLKVLFEHQKNVKDPSMLKDFSFFDQDAYSAYRKKTLDEGNEAIREIEQILDKVDFSLSENVREELKK